MKNILFIMLFFSSVAVDARLFFNPNTGIYYSKGASKKVDKIEYHNLAIEVMESLYIEESLFELRMIGSPASLRLANDLIELIRENQRDLKRMNKR